MHCPLRTLLQGQALHVHRVAALAKIEAARGGSTVGAEAESAVGAGGLRGHTLISVLLIVREILLNDVVGLHVNLLVGVVLAVVDLLHTTTLLNEEGVTVDGVTALASSLLVEVANLKNVLKTIESNLDDLVVGAGEEIAERLDAALSDEVSDLLRLLQTSRSGVADGPASLLAGLQVTVLEKVDQRRNDVGIDNGLDLGRVAGGNVGDGPASLLADTVLGGAEQRKKAGQSTAVDDDLGLDIVTGDNVSDGAQRRGLDRGGSVHEQLHESAGDAGLDNGLDLVVGPIRQVRDGPASIDQHLVVERVDQLGKDGEGRGDLRAHVSLRSYGSMFGHLRCSSRAEGSCHGRSCSESRSRYGAC